MIEIKEFVNKSSRVDTLRPLKEKRKLKFKSMRIDQNEIKRAKYISIVKLLQINGFEPCKEVGKELVYHSPFRTERSPSFFVNTVKNCFNDFGGGEDFKGDSIKLAQLLFNLSFQDAVKKLLELDSVPFKRSFSFSGNNSFHRQESKIEIVSVCQLENPALISYVRSRGISDDLANLYLKEVVYKSKGRKFFAVGFPNDKGGYELRNGLNFKGGKTINAITTIEEPSNGVLLFEGFFDFLSAMQYYGLLYPDKTTIILNSCNNLPHLAPHLSPHLNNGHSIHCFLDNDGAGEKVVQKLVNQGFKVKNWSKIIYPYHKDFNEYLMNSGNKNVS